ncbi:MAG: hypothetical protein C4324_04645 [Blastocatellia bacterium]
MKKRRNPIKLVLGRLGPGLITGASDDDPSGIATYSQAGASFGFATLWTIIAMLPLMIAVQHVSGKIGIVSGRGLAGVMRDYYSRKLLYPAVVGLLIANTINIGTDIAAIGAAINIFIPVPISILVVPIAVGIVVLQIWGSYQLIAGIFKWLTLTLFA